MNANFKVIKLICRCDACDKKQAQRCLMMRGDHGAVALCAMHAQALAWSAIRRAG